VRVYRLLYSSPIGNIEIVGTAIAILSVEFFPPSKAPRDENIPAPVVECARQLDEYFQGKRQTFRLPIRLRGTEFQKKVWRALKRIPYGRTRSYKDVARAIGREKAVRAVGGANHQNSFTIIIPCHRVIGSDGRLVGYGGSLWRKRWLLNHERKVGEKTGRRKGDD
jgi:methylated-DNA-[protein]-cysteine S-methyltransferase